MTQPAPPSGLHGDGVETLYGHLSGFAVTVGEQVRRGQIIGYVGSSGRSTGPHLHYEVRVRDTPVNPHKYLRETMTQYAEAGGGTHNPHDQNTHNRAAGS